MFTRALILALWCAYTYAQAPQPGHGDDDCALYLSGPGRSSAYDYTLNLLRGNFGYEGQHTCITYDAVNQAYIEARKRIVVSQPKGDWKPEDYASVGELILDISINLAKTYGLTYEEIEKGLPLIDTSRTLVREVCPPVFSHVECRAGKYRRLDGLCTNLQHPTWGATNAPFQRLIGPLFADGINAPRIAHTGRDLPLSRVVSRTMHPDEGFHDHAGTVMVIAWGQFMDHDYTLTGTPLDPINRNDPEECCKRPQHLKHPYCNEIRVPDDDYFYRLFGVKCIDFVRGFPSPRPGCRLGSRAPFNTLTGVIDGNTVYGVTEKFARKLRTGYGGLLRMNPVFKDYGLKDLLPLKLDIPDEGCTRPNKNMYCFEAGEIRVNEQLVLTVMHTLMAREHNRVAQGLAEVNPHWDDETLYQEARRINIAEIQHITYNEFLPILLGKDVMEKFGLVLEKDGYWDGYDQNVNPDVIASFAAAAYRFGHSLLPTAVERWSKAHKFIASKRLSDLIRRPYDLYRAGVLDEYVMGLMNQVAQAMDDSITQEVTNHLFKKVGARFGMDLVSFNMQRGREFGLPGYMEFRKFCGLSGADSFQDLFGSMPNDTVRRYESIFEHPIDVDLWSGGVSEKPLPGSMLGPTFACVIATQFSYSRRGDRFWFELPNQPSSFTPEQLHEVRKARLARVICDNTDIIDTVQLYPMVLPDHELNPRVPCRSGIIPSMDFSKWAEPAPFHGAGAAKQFVTEAIASNDCAVLCDYSVGTDDQNQTTVFEECIPDLQDVTQENKTNENKGNNNTSSTGNTITNVDCLPETQENEIPVQDTLLKYVDSKNNLKTPTLHVKEKKTPNSLKRKKRSSRQEYLDAPKKLPLILDYKTSHYPKDREPLSEDEPNIPNVIQSANLADFNIETLHDSSPASKQYTKKPHYKNKNYKTVDVEKFRDENPESENIQHNRYDLEKPRRENIVPNKNYRKPYEDDAEEPRKYSNDEPELQNNSHENISDLPRKENIESSRSKESDESEENEEKSYYRNPQRISKQKKKDNYNSKEDESDERESTGSSQESNENYSNKPSQRTVENDDENSNEKVRQLGNKNENYKSSEQPQSIQDVDLRDFSYERIQLNKEGEVESANDPQEHSNLSEDRNSPNILKTEASGSDESSSHSDESEEAERNQNQKLKTNAGEIRPVIELNGEQSSESNEDNDPESENAAQSEQSDDEAEKNDKLVQGKKAPPQDVNLKQDFERIPKNYEHDKEIEQTEDQQIKPEIEHSNEEIESDNGNEENIDDTPLPLKPKDQRYDEHLKYKFDDISIKLPDIKLPEDILAYNYEEPDKKQDKDKKKKFYHEDTDANPQYPSQYREDVDEDLHHGYKGYYKDEEEKQNFKKSKKPRDEDVHHNYDGYSAYHENEDDKEDYRQSEKNEEKDKEEEDEDLYEKFVRERFGKKGNFQKRSEKLQDYTHIPENPQLFNTIQKILKKTEDTQKEADKSGDPNAEYAWTLEYGQNL